MKNLLSFILGCFSYVFYKLVVRSTRHTREAAFWHQGKEKQTSNENLTWQPLSRWLSNGKDNSFAMMMMGPRWNCNATLAISDMFYVAESIDIDMVQANSSAKFWTAVVYDMNFKTITHLGSSEIEAHASTGKLSLTPGHYFIAIRYYETTAQSVFPEVKVDNISVLTALNSEKERIQYEQYLKMLSSYRSWLFLAMHYHAYAFLKNRHWLNAQWVNKTYLPVGNPETTFTYGTIKKGQRLQVSAVEYPQKRTYISIYNKASLPVYWSELSELQETPPSSVSGTFAIRQISSNASAEQLTKLNVNLA